VRDATGISTTSLVLLCALAVFAFFAMFAPTPAYAAECTECHTPGGMALDGSVHPVPPQPAWDPADGQCTICHEFISFIPDTEELYQDPPHGPYWIDLGGSWRASIPDHDWIWEEQCWSCHSGSSAHDKPFGSSTPLSGTIDIAGSDCAGCHMSGMSVEVPQVDENHGDPAFAHIPAVDPECAECHGSDLVAIHPSCDTCHFTDPTGETCSSCHPAFTTSHVYVGFSKDDQYVSWATALSLGLQNPDADLMARGPHSGYATTTVKCAVCHSVHRGGTTLLTEGSACAYCHTGAYYGGGAVASTLISWAGAGPHAGRCVNDDCHGGPHGVGASVYDGPASRLISEQGDAELDELAAANAIDTSELATWTATTRALSTGALCGRSGCHDDSVFGVVTSGATQTVDAGGAIPEPVTGHRVIAEATTSWNANGTDFPTTKTNLTIAFKPVSYCSSCHDLTDDNNAGKPAFPHSIDGVVSASQGADGSTRPAVWLTAAANAGETGQIVGPYDQYTGDGATVAGSAGSSIIDGVCLKCHRAAGDVRGIGIDDGAPLPGGPDITPPVTTSDAQSIYAGSATINLTPDDGGGSGVALTYYTVDGGAQQTGTTISVNTEGSHTIEFWSIDFAGNVETPPKTATFTVGKSTLAFVWHPIGPAGATLHVENESGVTIAGPVVLTGSGTDLDWYVPVVSGQNYRMVCDDWFDEYEWEGGGGYSVWSNDPVDNYGNPLNPDGILSLGETVTWYY